MEYRSAFRNLKTRRLQLDEMWAWIYCKEKNCPEEIAKKHPDAGDVWLWVAVDADTKLVPQWMLGQRDFRTAKTFVADLANRLANRVQITSDGHRSYIEAIEQPPPPGTALNVCSLDTSRNTQADDGGLLSAVYFPVFGSNSHVRTSCRGDTQQSRPVTTFRSHQRSQAM
jgi:IS1 family transposase